MAVDRQPRHWEGASDGGAGAPGYEQAANGLYEEAQADMAAGRWELPAGKLEELAERDTPPARPPTIEDVRRARDRYQARLAASRGLAEYQAPVAPRGVEVPRGAARGGSQLRTRVLGGIAVVLGVACLGLTAAGLQARSEIEARNAAIATQQGTIAEITAANLRFQSELSVVRNERDGLQQRVADSEAAAGQLRSRAEKAESRGTALADVVKVDEEIYGLLGAFLKETDTASQAIARRDYVAAANSYVRLERISAQLAPLVERRKALTARL